MLFLGIFTFIFSNLEIPVQLLFYNMNEDFVQTTSMLGMSLGIAYTYYLGYRIFIKRFDIDLFDRCLPEKKKWLYMLVSVLSSLVVIRVTWHLWGNVIADTAPAGEGNEYSQLAIFEIIYSVIMAPVMEETVFRGWLLKLLRKYGVLPAVLISSFAFGLYHGNIYQSIPAFVIGIILAYLTLKYASLVPSIAVHMLTNAISTFSLIPDEASLMKYLIPLSVAIIIIWFIINIRNLPPRIKELPICLQLNLKSISWIVFCILYVLIVVISSGFIM